jgi:hypothetical protein
LEPSEEVRYRIHKKTRRSTRKKEMDMGKRWREKRQIHEQNLKSQTFYI